MLSKLVENCEKLNPWIKHQCAFKVAIILLEDDTDGIPEGMFTAAFIDRVAV